MTNLQSIIDAGGPWQQARIIGGQLLIQGDCRDIIGGFEFDAICTDPPYGIGESKKAAVRTQSARGDARWRGRGPTDYKSSDWDYSAPDLRWIAQSTKPAIVWGGNYFGFPKSSMWLVWDKMTCGADFADCELAWTNQKGAVRKFEWLWSGFRKQAPEKRYHPTQKPIALMEWCLGFLPDAQTILDPFAGSFTTAVACQRLGRQSISIELDPDYYQIGLKRVQEVVNNPPLFTPAPPKPIQDAMDI